MFADVEGADRLLSALMEVTDFYETEWYPPPENNPNRQHAFDRKNEVIEILDDFIDKLTALLDRRNAANR